LFFSYYKVSEKLFFEFEIEIKWITISNIFTAKLIFFFNFATLKRSKIYLKKKRE